jgi:hypothetical protein
MTDTGQFDSKHSLIKMKSNNKNTLSLNLYIQMEFCQGENLQVWLDNQRKKDMSDADTIT